MSAVWQRILGWLAGGVLTLPVAGCALLVDALAPSLPLQLGLDPATIKPQQGVVIVAFNNTTQFPAEFFAYEIANVRDTRTTSRNFSATVEAGQQQNEVLDCPVDRLAPGSLDASFAPVTTAVNVSGAAGGQAVAATVAYTGPVLEANNAYNCGDLIEIRLSATGTGTNPTFSVAVRVIRGR
jgi:hypothetical protein